VSRPLTLWTMVRACAPALCVMAAMAGVPGPVWAGWQPVGPWGGAVEVVRAVPDVRDAVVAATRTGVLFTSADGGGTWSEQPFPARSTGVLHALEIDPRRGSVWYVGMEGSTSRTSGVYRTTDAGRTWTQLPGMTGIAVWSLAFAPSNPDIIAAGTDAGVYLSRNSGTSWALVSPPGDPELRPVVSLAFDPRDSQAIYAGTTHLPWRTGDGGATWQPIHAGMLDDSDVFSIAVDPQRPARVLASACSGAYGSLNGGQRWTRFATPRGAFRIYFIALDPRHPAVVFAGTAAGLLRSTDEGATWRRVSPHLVKSLAFDPAVPGRIFFASTDGGLLISTDDGNTVRDASVGVSSRTFTGLVGVGRSLYLSGTDGLYRSDDVAQRWVRVGGQVGGSVGGRTGSASRVAVGAITLLAPVPGAPRSLVGAGPGGVATSADGGRVWLPRPGLPAGVRVKALLARAGGVMLSGTAQGLYRGDAAGRWLRVSATPVDWLQATGPRALAAVSATAAQVSDDDGSTWVTCGAAAPGAVWYGLSRHPENPALVLAATSRGVFRSIDGCRTWLAVAGGLEQATAAAVLFHPTRAGHAFTVQGGRGFRSTDGGLTWLVLEDGGRRDFWPSSLAVLEDAPERLFALVPGRGVFSMTVGEVAVAGR